MTILNMIGLTHFEHQEFQMKSDSYCCIIFLGIALLFHTFFDPSSFSKLRRQLGRKVLELGGNAVLSYHQQFDLEGESGIVVRGYGTSCSLRKVSISITNNSNSHSLMQKGQLVYLGLTLEFSKQCHLHQRDRLLLRRFQKVLLQQSPLFLRLNQL